MANGMADAVNAALRDDARRGLLGPKGLGLIGEFVRTVADAARRDARASSRLLTILDEFESRWRMLRAEVESLIALADRPESVGGLRRVADLCITAGRASGEAAQAREIAGILATLLDEATAKFDPQGVTSSASNENFAEQNPTAAAWRDGRRELWKAIDDTRKTFDSMATAIARSGSGMQRQADDAVARLLAPRKGLRQRLAEAALAGVAAWEGKGKQTIRVEVSR